MKHYRVFTAHLGWCECMYIFHDELSFREIKNDDQTSILTKYNYIGKYLFDEKFLTFYEKKSINDKVFYIKHTYDNK